MGASANAGNRLPAFARAPALPPEVVYVRRVAQCLPRYHLRFRHEEVHWRLRPCTTSVALDGGANYLFAVDNGPILPLSLTASKGPVTVDAWALRARTSRPTTFVSSRSALNPPVCVVHVLVHRPIVAPGLDGCRGPPIPIRLSRVMSESTPAVKVPRLRHPPTNARTPASFVASQQPRGRPLSLPLAVRLVHCRTLVGSPSSLVERT